MLTLSQKILKRTFDIIVAIIGLFLTWWIIVLAWIVASLETKSNGLFIQKRVGENGRLFNVYKIKTMKPVNGVQTTITSANDVRITKSGLFFRRTKIDELPQLVNVLLGNMSFIGPRPDVSGYADLLEGDDKIVLFVKPGITGPASIKYKDEEEILARQENPKEYNDKVIWPDKIKINKEYVQNWSLKKDIMYMIKTIAG